VRTPRRARIWVTGDPSRQREAEIDRSEPETAVLVRRSVRIVNPRGLHARPCHALVSAALEFESRLSVNCAGREVDGKSILSLMTLSCPVGSELELIAEGSDAQALIERLSGLVNAGFGESD
jgi:phosphocarrier protein